MKKLLILLALFTGFCAFGAVAPDAAYVALGLSDKSNAASQKRLFYFDADGKLLDSVAIDTSAFANATKIAFGPTLTPVIGSNTWDSGPNGMILLRQTTDGGSGKYVNVYKDPFLQTSVSASNTLYRDHEGGSGGGVSFLTLATLSGAGYADLGIFSLGVASDGRLAALIRRNYDTTDPTKIRSLIYYYSLDVSVGANGNGIGRDSTGGSDYLDFTGDRDYIDFAYGIFSDSAPTGATDQLALLDASGNITIAFANNTNTSVLAWGNTFNIDPDGKDILSIWGDDNYTLGVLYDTQEMIFWDALTGTKIGDYAAVGSLGNSNYEILAYYKTGDITIVPEAGTAAALLGIFALLFVAHRKRR